MNKKAWEIIESFYTLSNVDPAVVAQFRHLKTTQSTHTKDAGNPHHYCVFFLPIHRQSGQVYLGHHKKAVDWIPPGGHIEGDELPPATATREMQEELSYSPKPSQLTPYSLSVKPIGRAAMGCLTHFDIWYLVELQEKHNFDYLTEEYYDARWFTLEEAGKVIAKNPDFARIISTILNIPNA